MLPILNQSFWRDEAFSVLLAMKDPWDMIRLTAKDVSPPLYYLVLHYWIQVFGTEESTIRTLSVLFHVLTVFVTFLIVRAITRSRVAQILIPAAVLLNPFLFQYSFEARAYSLLALLILLAVYAVVIKRYVVASIVLGIAILTHNFAIFSFFGFALWWTVTKQKYLKEGITLALFPCVAILLWGSVVWSQWTKVASGFWITQPPTTIFLKTFEIFSHGDLDYFGQPMLYTVTLIVCFLAFSYWMIREKKEESAVPKLLLSVGLTPVVITYLISTLFTPIYHERYLIATAPILIILVGYSFYRLFLIKRSLQYTLIAVMTLYFFLLWQAVDQIAHITTKPALNYGMRQILTKANNRDIIIPKDILNFLEVKLYTQLSGKPIKVYAYKKDGKIPFYIGSILFAPEEILTELPKDKTIWELAPDGGHRMLPRQ